MEEDPFARGPFPVGVRTGEAIDRQRDDRRLPIEVWYPALPRYGELDLAAPTRDVFTLLPGTPPLRQAAVRDATFAPGRYPLVLFSHPSNGHRRQSSFLCTHLASHGYVVAAADHVGNTFAEAVARAATGVTRSEDERSAYIQRIIADRVPDLRVLLDAVTAGTIAATAEHIDPRLVGLVGWSFGGWAVLATPEADDRFGAVVAMAPGGSANPLPGIIPATLTFNWRRAIPVLLLAAERDRSTPLPGLIELYGRVPSPKSMVVLRHADHDHFGDHIEVELCPRYQAHLFARGLALAHLDAALKDDPAARHFLANDPVAALRERGVDARTHPGP